MLISHGHLDHAGGAKLLQERFGARLLMTAADWDMVERDNPRWKPKRDLEITDGQKLTLGDTTLTMYVTPGHTNGTVSTLIPLRDGGAEHLAALWGGTLFNFGPDRGALRGVPGVRRADARHRDGRGRRRAAVESHRLRRHEGQAPGAQDARGRRAASVRRRRRTPCAATSRSRTNARARRSRACRSLETLRVNTRDERSDPDENNGKVLAAAACALPPLVAGAAPRRATPRAARATARA